MPVFAQFTRHYPASSFLRAENTFHVARDRNGYLWFSTDRGVIKYDGENIQKFSIGQGLPDHNIFNVYEDRRGRLWLFTYNGQYCFIKDGHVYTAANDIFLKRLPPARTFIDCITEGEHGELYFGFTNGDILYADHNAARWIHRNTGKVNPVGLMIQEHGYLKAWLMRSNLEIRNGKIIHETVTGSKKTSVYAHGTIISDQRGLKIYKNDSLIYCVNDSTLNIGTLLHVLVTSSDLLFCSTTHGLEIIDMKRNKKKLLLRNKKITCTEEDIAGNFWVTTYDDGVYMLHKELDAIKPLQSERNIDKIWLQNERIVMVSDRSLLTIYRSGDHLLIKEIVSPFEPYYNVLHADDQGIFYIDSWKKEMKGARGGISSDIIAKYGKKIFSCSDTFLMYGNNQTLYFIGQGGKYSILDSATYADKIRSATQDPVSRATYFLTGTELYLCDFSTATSKCILSDTLLRHVNNIYAVAGWLIATTNTNDLYRVAPALPRLFTRYTNRFTANGIVPMHDGSFLINSDDEDYIARFTSTGKFSFRTLNYPFSSTQYNTIIPFSNYLIVRTNDGVYYFPDSLARQSTVPPKVVFNGLTINNVFYTDTNITLKNVTQLDIRIIPGVLSFGSGEKRLGYRIKNEGSNTWHVTSSKEINLILNKPGDYWIEIMPAISKNTAAPPVRIHILAVPPFTSTTGFIFLILVGILAAGVWAITVILRRRRQGFERELTYLKLEHKAINALLNPHFIFNAINNIQSLIHHEQPEAAATYLSTMSLLIRQNMENLQHTLIPMNKELTLVEHYVALQNLRYGNNIYLEINNNMAQSVDKWLPPLLIHSFVENAIVHGYKHRERSFHISITIEPALDELVVITITDDGIGLQQSKGKVFIEQKSSMGIAFNRKRLQRISEYYKLKQSITTADRAAKGHQGTEVVIVLHARLYELLADHHPAH